MVPSEVRAVIEGRRTVLGPIAQPFSRGRILCVLSQTGTQMTEGVPASDGVIDESYLPPWDGWFAVLTLHSESHLLLAWIPQALVENVQSAVEIAATTTTPTTWLDEDFPPPWATAFEAEQPYWRWGDTNWGRLPPEDQHLIRVARRQLCRTGIEPLLA